MDRCLNFESTMEKRMQTITIQNYTEVSFLKDVLECFSKETSKKSLSYWWLYDKVGSEIFEEITEIPEYYLTECELSILKQYSETLVKQLKAETVIIELGSGSSKKTRILLEAFIKVHKKCKYIPIDISKEILIQSAEKLLNDYGLLETMAINATYDDALRYIEENLSEKHKLLVFLGSSIGNLEEVNFLKKIKKSFQRNDKLLVGIDLMKDNEQIVKLAYSDPALITEKFILNILIRIKNELKADLDISNFKLDVEIKPASIQEEIIARVELYIKSLKSQKVSINGNEFLLEKNERIHIENSNKYSLKSIEKIASESGFSVDEQWFDEKKLYSLNLFGIKP